MCLMNTPSHLIINAALRKALAGRVSIPMGAALWGGLAPDLPLYLLSFGGFAYYRWGLGWETERVFRYMYDTLFFSDPFWIASHNLLHAPLVLLAGIALTWGARHDSGGWRRWLLWFFLGCLVHTTIDITCHVDDGPLLLFPFNWALRFQSPVSYWDDRHYGREFALFELALDLALLAYLIIPALRRRWGRPVM